MRLATHPQPRRYLTRHTKTPLKQQVVSLRPEVKVIKEQFEQLMQHNHKLQLEVDAMARKFFGEGSEKLNPAQ